MPGLSRRAAIWTRRMGCQCASSRRIGGLSASRYAAASIAWSNLCSSILNGNRDDQAGERRACSDLSKDATRNLLFGGQTVSVIGDALYAVALPWLILSNGGNAQDLGIVLTAY